MGGNALQSSKNDHTAEAQLAEQVEADILLILTEVEKVTINYNKPNQVDLSTLNLTNAAKYIEERQFAAGSMLPKVEAAMKFVRAYSKQQSNNHIIG